MSLRTSLLRYIAESRKQVGPALASGKQHMENWGDVYLYLGVLSAFWHSMKGDEIAATCGQTTALFKKSFGLLEQPAPDGAEYSNQFVH
jgi:hypothetical protein